MVSRPGRTHRQLAQQRRGELQERWCHTMDVQPFVGENLLSMAKS